MTFDVLQRSGHIQRAGIRFPLAMATLAARELVLRSARAGGLARGLGILMLAGSGLVHPGAGRCEPTTTLRVERAIRPEEASRLRSRGAPVRGVVMRPEQIQAQDLHARRWRGFRDILSSPKVDWSPSAMRRVGWRPPVGFVRPGVGARPEAAAAATPPDTVRIAFLLIDFRADRGGDQSTGNGHFDLSGPDTTAPPIDRPPHNRAFYLKHLEALKRYYEAQSYGRTIIEGEVWPRSENGAYSLSDMADFGPWVFGQDAYRPAVRMFRAMFFAADSQAAALGDTIPWDTYDRFMVIHAGGDLQNDVRQDSPEDIPSFTVGLGDTDVVIFPDSTNRPIDRASFVPETNNQDGYFGTINGVIAHENGHNIFGFLDVYNTHTGLPVAGFWSLMDSGPNVGAIVTLADRSEIFATGLLPPSVDPWHRQYCTDSLSFPEVTEADTIALRNGERHADMRRVTLSSDEYLLLENRWITPDSAVALNQDSLTRVILGPKFPDSLEYDALLPGPGILVWHIDESVVPFVNSLRVNTDQELNTNPNRLAVSVVEADGLGDLGDVGSPFLLGSPFDPWFRSNYPTLSDTTEPNLIPHIGTKPHRRLDFVDNPDTTMHFVSYRSWQLPGWPVTADFPSGGPQLLAVDADGDGKLEVCWAGGADSLDAVDSLVANPDSAALFAVRVNGQGLGGPSVYAFAHLDRRPRPLMAAIPIGGAALGPSYFAVTTGSSQPGAPGGQAWLLDSQGLPRPGWPATLPALVTTPPVFTGTYPTAVVVVGAADGRVYALRLDGSIAAEAGSLAGGVSGRLAVIEAVGPADERILRVAAGGASGDVAVFDLNLSGTGSGIHAGVWPRRIAATGFDPDFLWLNFDGATAGRSPPTCASDGQALIVHHADRLWAFCAAGEDIPGWGHQAGDTLVAALGAGDPDGDGFPEVLTQSIHSRLAFWNVTGYPSPGWPKAGTREDLRTTSPPLAVDVDQDGLSEVIGLNGSGILAALRADGKTPPGWPLATGAGILGAPVCADLNQDGSAVIVAPDRASRLYAYDIPTHLSNPLTASWTMVGGDPGRTSALPIGRTPTAPAPTAGPLVTGSLKMYPNPARRHPVSFAYRLTEPASVEFRILDTSGHEVASFARPGVQGENVVVWEPGALPAGLYVARLRFRGATVDHVEASPIALLK